MGISPRKRPDGTYPLDEELEKVLESYEVSFTLQPRFAKDGPSKRPGKGSGSDKKRQQVDGHSGHGKQKFMKHGSGLRCCCWQCPRLGLAVPLGLAPG